MGKLTGMTDRSDWPATIHQVLREGGVRQVPYVPDGGHARLLDLVAADPAMRGISLTTEEEGVALCAGAWLGGERAVLLMQSSGVGNCVNMLSLIGMGRFPLLTLVAMRGEWAEFNPWQVPMGAGTPDAFTMMGVTVQRIDRVEDVEPILRAALVTVFEGGTPMALLIGQRLIGAKSFSGGEG